MIHSFNKRHLDETFKARLCEKRKPPRLDLEINEATLKRVEMV